MTEYTLEQLQIICNECGYRFTKGKLLATGTYMGDVYYASMALDYAGICSSKAPKYYVEITREIIEHDGKAYTIRLSPNSEFLKSMKWTLADGPHYKEFESLMDTCFKDIKASIINDLNECKRKLEIMGGQDTESSNS